MKRTLASLFLYFAVIAAQAQKTYSDPHDIYITDELTFYGYDFSQTKLVETKRIGEDLGQYVFGWVGFLQERFNDEKIADWFRKKKAHVDFGPTIEQNKKVNGKEIAVYTKNTILLDSIQQMVNKYQLKEKDGIGLVVIVESFDKNTVKTSVYFTFFDIATKKVLVADYFVGKEADGYGLTAYWGTSLKGITGNYASSFRKRIKSVSGK